MLVLFNNIVIFIDILDDVLDADLLSFTPFLQYICSIFRKLNCDNMHNYFYRLCSVHRKHAKQTECNQCGINEKILLKSWNSAQNGHFGHYVFNLLTSPSEWSTTLNVLEGINNVQKYVSQWSHLIKSGTTEFKWLGKDIFQFSIM
jgi:hypothetical protein